jgi:hypothetical protein
MTKVFTVFFCGTAANHKMVKGASESGSKKDFKFTDFYPEGEIVARLWAQQTGREFFDKIIVDGPGSGGLQLNGAYFMDPGGLRGRGHSDPHGGVTGVGWEQNIQHALGVIIGKSFRTEQSIQSFRGVNSNRTNFAGRGGKETFLIFGRLGKEILPLRMLLTFLLNFMGNGRRSNEPN